MPRFLHTADWQIGLKANFAGERAEALKAERLTTAQRIIDIAVSESVDFLLLCGDTFDNDRLSSTTVSHVVDILASAGKIPVYVLPGNHDPILRSNLWESTAWRNRPSTIVFLDKEEPVEAPDCVLFPCPLRQKQSGSDPTSWITADQVTSQVRIGVAHGALDTLGKPTNFPIPPDVARYRSLDYVALGDWHGCRIDERLAYSGTPEPCKFDEVEPGYILITEVEAGGSAPKVEQRKVASLTWHVIDGFASTEEEVSDLLHGLPKNLSKSCLRFRVTPSTKQAADAFAEAARRLEKEAFWIDGVQTSLEILEECEVPAGFLSDVHARLLDNEPALVEFQRLLQEIRG